MRLFAIVAVSFFIQIAIHHIPALQKLFDIEPVTLNQCGAWILLGLIPLTVLEIRKVFRRWRW